GDGGFIEIAVHGGRSQVEIIVSDDGPGIAPEDRERVFVPFFSTKASGTGLGLALARKFIEEAGGTIRCEASPLTHGSCFRILLPASAGALGWLGSNEASPRPNEVELRSAPAVPNPETVT